MFQKFLGLTTVAAVIAATAYGCSSSDSPSTPAADGGVDSGDHIQVKKDGSTDEDTGATSTCAPDTTAIKAFAGGAYHSPKRVAGACDVDKAYAACLADTATDATCATFTAANAACGTCMGLESTKTDATWGVLVDGYFNVPGCVEIKGGVGTAKTCASALQDNYDCQDIACTQTNCPIPDDPNDPAYDSSEQAYEACIDNALAGGCKSYGDKPFAETGVCANILQYSDAGSDGLATAGCFQQDSETSDTYYKRLLATFCGP